MNEFFKWSTYGIRIALALIVLSIGITLSIGIPTFLGVGVYTLCWEMPIEQQIVGYKDVTPDKFLYPNGKKPIYEYKYPWAYKYEGLLVASGIIGFGIIFVLFLALVIPTVRLTVKFLVKMIRLRPH